MKLLVYSPLSLRFGGGFEHWLLEITKRLREFNVHTSLICTTSTGGDCGRFSPACIADAMHSIFENYSELPYIPASSGCFNFTTPNITGLRKLVNSSDYDIMYFANAYFLQDFVIASLKILHKRPVISGHHAVLFQDNFIHDLYIKTVSKKLLKTFSACHVLNSHDLQILRSWNLKQIYQIPIGVDVQKFYPYPNKEKGKRFKVLFVGRLVPQKGLDLLSQSIEMLNKAYSPHNEEIEFIIVGVGPLECIVKQLEKKYKNVTYLGGVSDKMLPITYRDCDLFVLPSRRETFGIVVLEAQASGLPVVASNIPGPQDIVIDNATGSFVRQNAESLADAIKYYHDMWSNNYETYKKVSSNSRKNALDRFSWEVVAKNMYGLLINTASCDFPRGS